MGLAAFLIPAVAVADLASDEAILEGRLMAPCCNVQTLDVHASPLADELRAEIHRRLQAGESASAVEAALIARYGDSIRAAPPGRDSRTDFAVVISAGAVAFAVGAILYFRRKNPPPPPLRRVIDGKWDARIDEELEHFEE